MHGKSHYRVLMWVPSHARERVYIKHGGGAGEGGVVDKGSMRGCVCFVGISNVCVGTASRRSGDVAGRGMDPREGSLMMPYLFVRVCVCVLGQGNGGRG